MRSCLPFRTSTFALVLVIYSTVTSAQAIPKAPSALDDYIKKVDPGFTWTVSKSTVVDGGKVTVLKVTSQIWQNIPWVHMVTICEPSDLKYPEAALLTITGGSINNLDRPEDAKSGMAMARLCGARVAVLPQVPNQPLLGDKTEDKLIAETFVRFLETKDATWPLLFPMVKSAVKTMDAVQQWGKGEGKANIKQFVVTGGSKRGWTTWLTGVVDPRVVAIAPMVIDTLNMKAQAEHAMEVWGKPSEQVHDYTERGLNQKFDEPQGRALWLMVDPYTYLDRLTLPKLIINGTNDRYWTVDSLNIYWNDLKGPKYVVYVPNSGHNLQPNVSYAQTALGAFFRHTLSKRPMPEISWEHGDDADGALRLTVTSNPAPKGARMWVALSDDRDFRPSTWISTPMDVTGGVAKGLVNRPEKGFIALMGDLEYEIDGISYHLSTQIRQTGVKGTK